MQTKKTKEKKSKKLSRQWRDNFSSWSIYEELLGQHNSFSPGPEWLRWSGFHRWSFSEGERQ